jgi:3-hydroxybutyryl-CoA dehydratase
MIQAEDKPFDSLRVGVTASFTQVITNESVQAFADVSGDYSPLHMDDAYASTTAFGERVVHGMLLGALVSRLVGMQLPGTRALLLKESLQFKKPVHIGDTVQVEGTVTSVSQATHIIELAIQIRVGDTVVAIGQVSVQVRDR